MSNNFISTSQAAQIAGVTPQTIRNLAHAHVLDFTQRGQQLYFDEAQVRQYADKIADVRKAELGIDDYLGKLKEQNAVLAKEYTNMRKRLSAMNMYPMRLNAIKEVVFKLLVRYANRQYDNALTPKQYDIIKCVFSGEEIKDIADNFGLTRERARQIFFKALRIFIYAKTEIEYQEEIINEQKASIAKLQSQIDMLNNTNEDSEAVRSYNQLVLQTSVSELKLSVRAYGCLKYAGIKTIGELIAHDSKDLMKIRNFGFVSLCEIKNALKKYNLWLGMNINAE